jgi:uncharacterized protein (DUF433 family)
VALAPLVTQVGHNGLMQDAITRDPEVMHGTPVFRGTRVPVKTLFDYLGNGDSLDDFLEGFPTVSRALAIQVLEASKDAADGKDAHASLREARETGTISLAELKTQLGL